MVPGGLGFAIIQLELEVAAGTIDADNLPRIAVSESDGGGAPPVVELRLVSATVSQADTLAAVVLDSAESGFVSSVQTIAVCVRLAGPNHLAVSGWSGGETLFDAPLREGDSQTIRINPPLDCGDQFIVAVAGR